VHLPILGWKEVNFLDLAGKALGLPVLIENNANAAAFGEVYCHPKRSHDLIVFLKLGNGCGGAAIVNGRLLRGTSGTATEFGHMRILPEGPVCSCGRRGCLEPLVNADALRRYAGLQDAAMDAEPEAVASLAVAGNAAALAAVKTLEGYLAVGLVNLTNLFNPSDIVLGGALRPVLEPGLPRLQEALRAGIVPGMTTPAIALSLNGKFECAIGAAAIAHQQAFDEASIGLA
jgi:N-acetylglucosamine repressor